MDTNINKKLGERGENESEENGLFEAGIGTGTTDLTRDSLDAQKQQEGLKEEVWQQPSVFAKSQRIARTPPRPVRSHSVADIAYEIEKKEEDSNTEEESTERTNKRKANESLTEITDKSSKKGHLITKKENPIAKNIIASLQVLTKTVRELSKRIEENSNTKREIKDIAAKLKRNTDFFERNAVKDWLEQHRWENAKVEEATQTNLKGTGKESTTQTEPWNDKTILRALHGLHTFDEWKEAEKIEWDDALYERTEIKTGNPLTVTEEKIKVTFVEKDDIRMEKGIQKQFGDRFSALKESTEEVEILEQTCSLRSKRGNKDTYQKIIKLVHENTEESIWNSMEKLKRELAEEERAAIHCITDWKPKKLRKLVEFVFKDTKHKINIYAKKETDNSGKSKTQRETYAMIVEEPNKNYREVLSTVKAAIGNKTAGKAIKGIRSTRDGKLLITTEKDKNVLESIQQSIADGSQNIKIRQAGQKTLNEIIYIRGIDALTSREEVVEALEAKLGNMKDTNYEIGELRPGLFDTQAVTIKAGNEVIEKLSREKALRIGMVLCSIEKHVKLNRCPKCWTYGHRPSVCGGPDRSKLCFKCGKEGHAGAECRNDEHCPICNKTGHKAGTGRCPEFRKALQVGRKKEKEIKQMSVLGGGESD